MARRVLVNALCAHLFASYSLDLSLRVLATNGHYVSRLFSWGVAGRRIVDAPLLIPQKLLRLLPYIVEQKGASSRTAIDFYMGFLLYLLLMGVIFRWLMRIPHPQPDDPPGFPMVSTNKSPEDD